MPFQRELDAIVREVSGVMGVILVDFEGEAVIGSSNGISSYDLKVVGAYGGIFRDQIRRLSSETGLGSIVTFEIAGSGFRIVSEALKDGYHLVLVASPTTPISLVRQSLRTCAAKLITEL